MRKQKRKTEMKDNLWNAVMREEVGEIRIKFKSEDLKKVSRNREKWRVKCKEVKSE